MRLFRPLLVKDIALVWGGLSTSAVGDQLGIVAITWVAVDAFGSAAGYLTALQAALTLLAALFIGRWTDGRNERHMMIAADVVRAIVLAAAVLRWEATGRVSATSLVALVVALAVGQAVFRPSVQAILPGLAPSAAMLPATNALLDATHRLARLVGPVLIALLASRLPTMHFLTLDAVSFLVSAAAIAAIGARPTRATRDAVPLAQAVLRGFRALRRHRLLGFLLATAGLNNGAWYASFFLGVPLLLARGGGSGMQAFGAVIACYGLTNLGANLIIGSRTLPAAPGRMILCGNILVGVGIMAIGACALLPGQPLWEICAAAALAGGGGPMNDIPRNTLMQTVPPAGDVPAVFRAWMVMANAGVLVGMGVTPTVFGALGPASGVAILGGLMAGGGVVGLLLRVDATDVPPRAARPAPQDMTTGGVTSGAVASGAVASRAGGSRALASGAVRLPPSGPWSRSRPAGTSRPGEDAR